jgi:hypothetical protein
MSDTPPRTGISSHALHWLGGALLLGVMSVTLFLVGMLSVDGSSPTCEDSKSSMGECWVATEQHRLERHLVLDGSVTLGVGALVCLAVGAVATVGERRQV